MAGALDLVEVAIIHAVDGTLNTPPDFRKHEVVVPKHVSEPFRHDGVLPPGLCFRGGFYITRLDTAEAIGSGQYMARKGPSDVISDLYPSY